MKKIMKKTAKKGRKYVNILGINVISTSVGELLANLESSVSHSAKFYIVTPNPELVLASTRNVELKKALENADFAVPDGVGLNYASKFLYGHPLNIIPGRKLFLELIKLSERKRWRVFLLGGKDVEAEKAALKLKMRNLGLEIMYDRGPMLNMNAVPVSEAENKKEKDTVKKINTFKPHLLFVAFQNPKQEIWVYRHLSVLNVRGAMAVGGTFRYIAGLSKLPPKWMEKAGLEWFWRLVTEPKRIGRIFNAFPLFPLRVLLYKISGRI